MIKTNDDIILFLQKNCRGYANRKSGKELSLIFDLDFRIISSIIRDDLIMKNNYPILNIGNGYFYATNEDKEILNHKKVLLISKFEELNTQIKVINSILKPQSEEFEKIEEELSKLVDKYI